MDRRASAGSRAGAGPAVRLREWWWMRTGGGRKARTTQGKDNTVEHTGWEGWEEEGEPLTEPPTDTPPV